VNDLTELGPYVAGEIPEPWAHTFLDADGAALNLTGYTAKLTYRLDGGTQVVRNATMVSDVGGIAGYTWVAADFATSGLMAGELVVGNGSNRYARSFRCRVRDPLGGTLPNI